MGGRRERCVRVGRRVDRGREHPIVAAQDSARCEHGRGYRLYQSFEVVHPVFEGGRPPIGARDAMNESPRRASKACLLGLVRVRPLAGLLERTCRVRGETRLARVSLVAFDPPAAGDEAGFSEVAVSRL